MALETKRIDDYRIKLLKSENMKTDALIYASDKIKIEPESLKQLQNPCSIEENVKVFATPDIHKGYGVPIGCVFASENFISPSACGYDVNCGMRILTTGLAKNDIRINLLANYIKKYIPLGEGKHNLLFNDKDFVKLVKRGVKGLFDFLENDELDKIFVLEDWERDTDRIEEKGSIKNGLLPESLERAVKRGRGQLGTLGGGNHFIEIQEIDEIYNEKIAGEWGIKKGELTVMIHSGSRGFGHEIAGYYMNKSLQYCDKNKINLTDRQFSYFPIFHELGKEYYKALVMASNFAYLNRQVMAMYVRFALRQLNPDLKLPLLYDVSHNIVKEEIYSGKKYCVHRKGATRAFDRKRMKDTPFSETGQPVLIPGSMGTSSYLLSGKSTGVESFYSVNHGAGRVMGRKAALGKIKKGKVIREGLISDKQFKEDMKNIYLICEDKRTIKEEAPGAYKDINIVIDTVVGAGLADKIARFIPLAVLKG